MSTPELNVRAGVEGFASAWRRVMTEPRAFFADMPLVGGLADPLTFLAICAGLHGLGRLVFGGGVAGLLGGFLGEILATFVLAAAVVMVAQHLFDGKAGFEPVFRVLAYASAPLVFASLPRLGALFVLWSWYIVIRGLERAHEFDGVRAVLTLVVAVSALALAAGALFGRFAVGLG